MKLTRVLKSVFLAFILLSTIQTAVTYSEEEVEFTLENYKKAYPHVEHFTLKLVGFPESGDYVLRGWKRQKNKTTSQLERIYAITGNRTMIPLSWFRILIW